MTTRGRILQSLIICSIFLVPAAFNGCGASTKIRFQSSNHGSSSVNYSGNGDSYDGKPAVGDYYRIVPAYGCASTQYSVAQKIRVGQDGQITLTTTDKNDCTQSQRTVQAQELSGSNTNRTYLSLDRSIFEKLSKPPDLNDRNLLVPEAWCFGPLPNSNDLIHSVVKVNAETGLAVAENFTSTSSVTTPGLKRGLNGDVVSYLSSDYSLTLPLGLNTPARLALSHEGKSILLEPICRKGGRLDILAPVEPGQCPPSYISVSPLAGITSEPFCVSKYEAKNINGRPQSVASGLPWVSVSRDQSLSLCRSLGSNYDLVSNAQWQTLARDIESNPANWSEGTIGSSGGLARGHTDNNPQLLEASTDDNQACFGTGQICDLTAWNSQRRVFLLSSGLRLWDIGGNAYEWVQGVFNSAIPSLDDHFSVLQGSIPPDINMLFGPAGTYSGFNTAPFAGLGVLKLELAGGAIRRGGSWRFNSFEYNGVFSAYTYDDGSLTETDVSFRCSYLP